MTTDSPRTLWLIGARADLLWLSGSSLLAFAAIATFHLLVGPLALAPDLATLGLFAVWTLLFDGTHFFATYSRTLLDPVFRKERRVLLACSAGVFVVGPVFLIGAQVLGGAGVLRAASAALNYFGLTWAYYHLCRQHWGLTALYRRKRGDGDVWARRLEAGLFVSGLGLPFVRAVARIAPQLAAVEFRDSDLVAVSGLAGCMGGGAAALAVAVFAVSRPAAGDVARSLAALAVCALGLAGGIAAGVSLGFDRLLEFLERSLLLGFALCAALRGARSSVVPASGSAPQWTLIASVLVAHHAILEMAWLPPVLMLVALTLFHNVQYHRIVRFHNLNHYRDAAQRSWAVRVTESPWLFAALALGFSLAYVLLRVASLAAQSSEAIACIAAALLWGVPFHHYVLDAVIWRPSRSPALRLDLGLTR